jgi:hypothetical protein
MTDIDLTISYRIRLAFSANDETYSIHTLEQNFPKFNDEFKNKIKDDKQLFIPYQHYSIAKSQCHELFLCGALSGNYQVKILEHDITYDEEEKMQEEPYINIRLRVLFNDGNCKWLSDPSLQFSLVEDIIYSSFTLTYSANYNLIIDDIYNNRFIIMHAVNEPENIIWEENTFQYVLK